MFFTKVLIIIMLLARMPNSLEYSCDKDSEACSLQPEFKYFFFEVSNQEGFNLRRDVYMRYAIMFAEMHKRNERLNWKLVLPPFYRFPHWRNDVQPIQWSTFFDINALRSYAPVVELKDIFKDKAPHIELDRVYTLQNYENAFEDGHFHEKWDTVDKCERPRQQFWGYATTAFETVCVKFQGKVSKLWEVISMHPYDKSVMIYHAEIPLHDSYGTKSYWDCRKSMKFNPTLIAAAVEYTKKHFQCSAYKCDSYISVHWRRGDYAYGRKDEIPSIKGAAQQIDASIRKHKLKTKNIFVATDADSAEMQLFQKSLEDLGYKIYFYLPRSSDLKRFHDGGIAIIEQIICSHAAFFIGSHESTFTYRIQEEREILGFNTSTTFNRLCPDKGQCEAPSVWKLID